MLCAAHPPSPAGETGLDSFGLMVGGAASGGLGLTELLPRERSWRRKSSVPLLGAGMLSVVLPEDCSDPVVQGFSELLLLLCYPHLLTVCHGMGGNHLQGT